MNHLPTPAQMTKALGKFVIGQDKAKRDIAVAVYNHYLSLAYASQQGAKHKDLGPQHILLLGPTGSGKTYLVRCLAELLGLPVLFASATSLVEVGYKGSSVDSLLENLLALCGGDTRKAERGIIFIDEFDKIRKASSDIGRDVSGEGVQNALLTLLDGRLTTISGQDSFRKDLDVSKVLFICAGAFAELPQIVRQRIESAHGFGFRSRRETAQMDVDGDEDAYAQSVHEDLIRYGFIPELIGRFASITSLKPLSEDELVKVLTDAEDSNFEKLTTLFALHGIDLLVPDESLRAFAQMARELGSGARGLVSLVRSALGDVNWRLPDLQDEGIDRILITPATVQRMEKPLVLHRDTPLPRQWEGAVALRSVSLKTNTTSKRKVERKATSLPNIKTLRSVALNPDGRKWPAVKHIISDASGWSSKQIADRLERVKEELDWVSTTESSAQRWWEDFERKNRSRPRLVLRLAEELLARKATIAEFYLAVTDAACSNVQAILYYLEYKRLKKKEESRNEEDPIGERDQQASPNVRPVAALPDITQEATAEGIPGTECPDDDADTTLDDTDADWDVEDDDDLDDHGLADDDSGPGEDAKRALDESA